MPVSIPYTWTQTAESLELRADIRTGNVSKDTMHIEVSPLYLKLNCPPSLLQLDLLHEIDADRVQMTLQGTTVVVKMQKSSSSEWASLTVDGTLDKVARLQRRQGSIAQREEVLAARAAARDVDRKSYNQASLESHWEIDRAQREAVLEIQNRERLVAIEELQAWKKAIPDNQTETKQSEDNGEAATHTEESELDLSMVPDLDDGDEEDGALPVQARNSDIWDTNEVEDAEEAASPDNTTDTTSAAKTVPPSVAPTSAPTAVPAVPAAAPVPAAVLPPVRRGAKVAISFTPDATPTPAMPARESMMAQKMAFKATQSDGQTPPAATGDSSTQQMPIFLKEKADQLFRNGDTLGAIAAYTSGIESATKLSVGGGIVDPLLVARCHANRASAWLKLAGDRVDTTAILAARSNLRKCTSDCTTSMTILAGISVEANSESALEVTALDLKNLHRRGTAHAWLGAYALAVDDLDKLLSRYTAAEQLRTRLQSMRDSQPPVVESKEADESASSDVRPAPLPALPPFDLAQLTSDRALFHSLLTAFDASQSRAFKAEGDRLLSTAASDAAAVPQAVAAYTQALLIHPGELTALSNRMVARLRLCQWQETLTDACLAIGLWEELWLVPRTGLSAVAPAPPSSDSHGLTPKSSTTAVSARPATALAISSRVKLFVRRATARAALAQWLPAQTDLQHALAIAPLTGSAAPAALVDIRVELDFVSHRISLARLKSKASLALSESRFLAAVDLCTRCIEAHNKVNDATAATAMAAADAWGQKHHTSHTQASTRAHHVSDLASMLSDRALAHLRMRAYAAAIKDASAALQVWEAQRTSDAARETSAAQPAWFLPTLVRRGSARAFQGDFTGAIEDYQAALAQWTTTTDDANADAEERAKIEADLQRIKDVAAARRTGA